MIWVGSGVSRLGFMSSLSQADRRLSLTAARRLSTPCDGASMNLGFEKGFRLSVGAFIVRMALGYLILQVHEADFRLLQ